MRRHGGFWAWPGQGAYWENTGRWDKRKGQVMISFCWPLVFSGTIILKKKKKKIKIKFPNMEKMDRTAFLWLQSVCW